MRRRPSLLLLAAAALAVSDVAPIAAQRVVAVRDVNVRSGQSTASRILGVLHAGDTALLAGTRTVRGYDHVEEPDSTLGWAYARYLRPISDGAPPTGTASSSSVRGSSIIAGCGDHLWRHVYHPSRLIVLRDCVVVRGTIVDATHGREPDGARHEADGDTHAWLRVDAPYRSMLDAGNMSDEGGNLVFEIVCHYRIRQASALAGCGQYRDSTDIPPVGTHVEITGSYVRDANHGHWDEIHPVSKIVVVP